MSQRQSSRLNGFLQSNAEVCGRARFSAPSEEALSAHRSASSSHALSHNSMHPTEDGVNDTPDRNGTPSNRKREQQQLRFYGGELKSVLIGAKQKYRVYLMAVNAYPSDRQSMAVAKDCFKRSCEELYGKQCQGKSALYNPSSL